MLSIMRPYPSTNALDPAAPVPRSTPPWERIVLPALIPVGLIGGLIVQLLDGRFGLAETLTVLSLAGLLIWQWRMCRERQENVECALTAAAARGQMRLEQMMAINPATIYTFRLNPSQLTFISGAIQALTGHTPDECLSNPHFWRDNLHPQDRKAALARQDLLREQGWLEHEYRFRCRDGSYRWIHDKLVLMGNGRDQPWEAVGAWLDITDLKQAQEQSSLWAKAIGATHNGIVIADATRPGYPILSVNPAYERITGYTAREVVGRSPRFLHRNDQDQPQLQELRQALRTGREAHVVLRNYRKDGTPFWNELYVAPVHNDDGRVSHFVGVQNDITERKRHEAQLLYQAHYDGLTGLPNRDLLQDRLQQSLAHAHRNGDKVAVLFTDLDRFKMINDSLGHRAGDELLRIVAKRLKDCVRANDTVARLSGDEFVIVLGGLTDDLQVARVGEKVLAVLQEPVVLENQDLFVNASVGVALFPRNGTDTATLLRHADTALHQAKEAGRGTLRFHSGDMQQDALRRLSLSADLRHALELGQLILHYQPQVSLENGRVVGVEALLRWEHPLLGMISPAEFIPLAEETGLIVPIGEWVLETACARTQAWHQAGLGPLTVAVNLSTRQFIQRNLPERIAAILQTTGLPSRYLELEITESLLMRDVKGAVETLGVFKDMGITLAIDDFGTGYSSLNYLKRFPLDRLKIDQSFVQDITTNPSDAAITLAIIDLARNLRLKVVAEGVETGAQLAFLRDKGCDDMQGWYFSRALPEEQLTELLSQGRNLTTVAMDEALRVLDIVPPACFCPCPCPVEGD